MSQFHRIGIVGRPGHSGVAETCQRLLDFLAEQSVCVVTDETTAALAEAADSEVLSREQLASNCDLVIVVGGDGSMLNMAKFIVPDQVPVIGINRGKLGFLTELSDGIEKKQTNMEKG